MVIKTFDAIAYLLYRDEDHVMEKTITQLDNDMIKFITNLMREEYCLLDEEGNVKVDIQYSDGIFHVTLDGNIIYDTFDVGVDQDGNYPYYYNGDWYLISVWEHNEYKRMQSMFE